MCAAIWQRAVVDESGMIRRRWGPIIDHKMALEHGTLCMIPPRDSTQKPARKWTSLYFTTRKLLKKEYSEVTIGKCYKGARFFLSLQIRNSVDILSLNNLFPRCKFLQSQ
jgi:hypothetical protein